MKNTVEGINLKLDNAEDQKNWNSKNKKNLKTENSLRDLWETHQAHKHLNHRGCRNRERKK